MNVENDFLDTERTSSPEHYINGVRNTYFSYIGSLVKNNFSHIKPIRRQKPLMYIERSLAHYHLYGFRYHHAVVTAGN